MPTPLNRPFPAKSFRMGEFNPRLFRDLFATQGRRVRINPASECPCTLSSDHSERRRDCPVCDGEGFEWPAALQVDTRAIITSLENARDTLATYGRFDAGTVRVTLQGEQPPAHRSRITLLDDVMQLQVLRRRGSGSVDTLRHPIVTPGQFVVGPLEANVATSGLLWLRRAEDGVGGDALTLGTDFTVNGSGNIDWTLGDTAGTAPAHGEAYAFVAFVNLRYVVVDHPHVVRNAEVKFKLPTQQRAYMPVQCYARLDNLTSEPQ